MSKSKKGQNHRSLEEIAAAYQAANSANIFVLGDLLLEAKETHPGEFLAWLQENEPEFGSVRSAENKMGAALLKRRFANIANLKVGKTTIYDLVEFDKKNPALTEIAIGALTAQTKGVRLTAADAERIMDLVRLRAKFGSHPDATLIALDDIAETRSPEPWHAKTTEILKDKRPETEEDADAITLAVLREHVEGLYGALPALDEKEARNVLTALARVPAEDRARVLERLTEPVTEAMIYTAMDAPVAAPAASSTTDAPPAAPPAKKDEPPKGKRDCPLCKGEGSLTGIFGRDKKPTTLPCPCTKPPNVEEIRKAIEDAAVADREKAAEESKKREEERQAKAARYREASDRIVSAVPEAMANEYREAMRDFLEAEDCGSAPADIFDGAFLERYPEPKKEAA
jgi:hypothetical protein